MQYTRFMLQKNIYIGGVQDFIYPKHYLTVLSHSSLNFLDHFQPGFSLPTFHCSNEIDQPNNLIFSVFLRGKVWLYY